MIQSFQRVLILENSARIGRVALAQTSTILVERPLAQAFRHATDLPLVIQLLLNEQGWKCDELTSIVVSLGPGSYTGLRVGVMAAKTLAYALGCPLFGIPSFAAIARQTPEEARVVDVIADGLKRTLFAQRFVRSTDDNWEAEEPIQTLTIADWKNRCFPALAISGPAVTVYADDMPKGCQVLSEPYQHPGTESLLREAMSGKHPLIDPWTVEPIYVRGSSAEEKRKKTMAEADIDS